jgi:hypothetical protein
LDWLIDVSVQFQERLDEVCALCGYHTRKYNGVDNKQAALDGWMKKEEEKR